MLCSFSTFHQHSIIEKVWIREQLGGSYSLPLVTVPSLHMGWSMAASHLYINSEVQSTWDPLKKERETVSFPKLLLPFVLRIWALKSPCISFFILLDLKAHSNLTYFKMTTFVVVVVESKTECSWLVSKSHGFNGHPLVLNGYPLVLKR